MKKLLLIMLLASLTACKKKAPKCDDKEVVKLVNEIIYNNLHKTLEEHFLPNYHRVQLDKETVEKELKAIKERIDREVPALNPNKTEYRLEQIRTINLTTKMVLMLVRQRQLIIQKKQVNRMGL
jgi:hypothetical protein